jgi:thioredoxin reductase (NADPH)
MKDVLIYATRGCPYCVVAKRALDARGIPYREVDITFTPHVRDELKARTGEWTVPQVFVDDAYIGQDDELVALVATGALDAAPEAESEAAPPRPPAPAPGETWDAAVIGAGRWGLAVGRALAEAGPVVVIERAPYVPRADPDHDRLRAAAEAAGATLRADEVFGLDPGDAAHGLVTLDAVVPARVVVVATGRSDREPSLPGEAALLGRGVSHCARCDAAFFEGLPVAVVGSDERACAEALFLAGRAAEVTLLCPAPALDAGPATLRALAAARNLRVRAGAAIRAIAGDTHVTGVLVEGPQGRASLEVAGVFVYLAGDRPGTAFLHGTARTAPGGALIVSPDGETSLPRLFAVGPAAFGGAAGPDAAAMRVAAAARRLAAA